MRAEAVALALLLAFVVGDRDLHDHTVRGIEMSRRRTTVPSGAGPVHERWADRRYWEGVAQMVARLDRALAGKAARRARKAAP